MQINKIIKVSCHADGFHLFCSPCNLFTCLQQKPVKLGKFIRTLFTFELIDLLKKVNVSVKMSFFLFFLTELDFNVIRFSATQKENAIACVLPSSCIRLKPAKMWLSILQTEYRQKNKVLPIPNSCPLRIDSAVTYTNFDNLFIKIKLFFLKSIVALHMVKWHTYKCCPDEGTGLTAISNDRGKLPTGSDWLRMFEGQGWKKKKKKGHQLYAVGHQHSDSHDTFVLNWRGTLEAILSCCGSL